MSLQQANYEHLNRLLAGSNRPVYAIDHQRRIVYCNSALAKWLGVPSKQIVGRHVEYHSEPVGEEELSTGFLPGLCPPPAALEGNDAVGTVSSMDRGGSLINRRARFFALSKPAEKSTRHAGGVLVLLDERDLTPAELSSSVHADPSSDELHRTIRQFRKGQSRHYAVESLLGDNSAMQRVRAQVAAAASNRANALVVGPPGSGRSHVARAIHYKTNRGQGTLLPIDCRVTREDPLRQAVETLGRGGDPAALHTLLLEGLDSLAVELQQMLAQWLKGQQSAFRVIGISASTSNDSDGGILPSVRDALATMTISVPRLCDRLEDLPILAQFFLESCNRDKVKQVGGIAPDALDLLNLYDWPGELDQLRGVIAEAHAACQGHEIAAGDLPRLIHQAAQAAAQPRKTVEKVDLDQFLSSIERELIERALRQAGGNKTEAAELLGMTRPRLYRRLQQCGLDDNSEGENNGETS